jgi:hypothetical protein
MSATLAELTAWLWLSLAGVTVGYFIASYLKKSRILQVSQSPTH